MKPWLASLAAGCMAEGGSRLPQSTDYVGVLPKCALIFLPDRAGFPAQLGGMVMVRLLGIAALVFFTGALARGEWVGGSLARFLSPELRVIEARLAEVEVELKALPKLIDRPFASRFGFRSATLGREDGEQWARIDLGKSEKISRIVAVPVNVPVIGAREAGYGFPRRFRIEVADNPGMEGAVTVVDRTAEDVPNPGVYPVDFPLEGVEGRYVRFVSTRHFQVEDGFIWALEELLVLSGNRAVSVGILPEASSSLDLYPNWSIQRLNDGYNALGMPVSVVESPSHGHQSAAADFPAAEKWLAVDLGRELPIDEIRLLPAEGESFEHLGLRSFPRGYVMELAGDGGFSGVTWKFVFPKTNLVGFPGGRPVIMKAGGARGRYLRLRTTELWGEGNRVGFALAELQAYSGDENVALGKAVTASDTVEGSPSAEWFPAAVVDGNTSQHRIIEIPEHLDLIARRGALEREKGQLSERRERKVALISGTLGYGGGGLVAALALGALWTLGRQRMVRENDLRLLREQIARDLHDDIGSNLGGIVLLSEIGELHCGDSQAKEDFKTIREAADTTSQAMQDIVWLIERDNIGLRELVTRMRHSAERLLGENTVSLTVSPADFPDRHLSLFFRRHVFFAFKETINNVRKHSGATEVEVNVRIAPGELRFEVRDNGCGFEMESTSQSGHGLANLRRRATRVKGGCTITSAPGKGTLVAFRAPLKSQ